MLSGAGGGEGLPDREESMGSHSNEGAQSAEEQREVAEEMRISAEGLRQEAEVERQA